MKPSLLLLLLAMSIPAAAQSADAIYQRACGPKDALFNVKEIKAQPAAAPEPGKALVYFVQYGGGYTTRVGLDGAWVGAFKKSSYFALSVAPGEHHACVSWQRYKYERPQFVSFTAEAGKTYYYLVRSIAGGQYAPNILQFGPTNRDEALYLIGSYPKSVATPKPAK